MSSQTHKLVRGARSMPAERTAPHNLDAERSVLGAVLVENTHLPTVRGILDASDFYRDAHQRIYRAMAALHDRHSAIDFVTLKDELSRCGDLDEVGGPVYASSLADGVPRSLNVPYYAAIVRDCARLRDLIHAVKRVEGCAYDRDVEALEVEIKHLQGAAANLTRPRAVDPVVTNMAAVADADGVRWLWPHRIAFGQLTLLQGEPGVGKTWLTLDVIARISTHRELPGGAPRLDRPLNAVVMANEDGPAATKRRLEMLGADLSRVHLLNEKEVKGRRLPVTLEDLELIERVIVEASANFLVIDPVNAFMTGDSYKDVDVRRRLAPLVNMARERNVAVMCLTHMAKEAKRSPLHRALGSIGFMGSARLGLELAADVLDAEQRRRLLFTIKNNLSADESSLAYTIVRGRLVWEAGPQIPNYDSLVAASQGKDTPEQMTAVEFLRALMNDERETWPLRAKETVRKASEIGISPTALQRARKQLGLTSRKHGFNDKAEWRWHRPRRARKGTP